jgi:hypothetical protein
MFERLAKIRTFEPWLKAPRHEAVCSDTFHSNDNRPGFRRPAGQGLGPQQALACHWFPSRDGRGLECRWEPEAREDRAAGNNRDQLRWLAGPPLVPVIGGVTVIEHVAD